MSLHCLLVGKLLFAQLTSERLLLQTSFFVFHSHAFELADKSPIHLEHVGEVIEPGIRHIMPSQIVAFHPRSKLHQSDLIFWILGIFGQESELPYFPQCGSNPSFIQLGWHF